MERQCVISVCGYEGGLSGLSLGDFTATDRAGGKLKDLSVSENLKEPVTEYAFTATQGSIKCVDGSHNLMALGGFDEVIRLFDVYKKKDLGDLMGEHQGTITALQFHQNQFLISASEDSKIIIWRCKDWVPLHTLKIKNVSPILAMSLHPSGKMLLALYDNGVMRLWDMMQARCVYKRKMGLLPEVMPEHMQAQFQRKEE